MLRAFFKLSSILSLLWYEYCVHSLEDVEFNLGKVNKNNFKRLSHLAALEREELGFEIDQLNIYYWNHPFERLLNQTDQVINATSSRRETSSPTNAPSSHPTLAPTRQPREPIRFAFETFELDKKLLDSNSTNESINVLKQRILPRISEIWSSILSVVPVEGSIPIQSSSCYGYYDIPDSLVKKGVTNADLVVFVSGFNSINGISLCDGNVLASASHCSLDQYDRPVVGFVNFCLDNINLKFEDSAVAVGVHELGKKNIFFS